MRKILLWLAASVLVIAVPAFADLPTYTLIKEKSFLKFFAIQNGAPVEGRFTDFNATIHFDPDHLDQSDIAVEVATGSVTVADNDIVTNLKLPAWLSVDAFPKAVFKCKKLSRFPQSDNYYAGFQGADYCQLTLRGKTMPVALNFQIEHMDEKGAIAKGFVTLRRSDFGIGQGQWAKDDVIKNEVRVEFRIVTERKVTSSPESR